MEREELTREPVYNGSKTEIAECFWKGFYTRTSEIPDAVLTLYITRTLNSHIADYILILIAEAERKARRETAVDINKCLFGYPKDKDFRIQSAIDKCNSTISENTEAKL